jgi:O-antigen biosynthesis protein
MKNLLFIARSTPNKIKSAGDIRALNMLKILRQNYEVDVVARSADFGDSDIKGIDCRSHSNRDIRAEIVSILQIQKPEVVIISHWTMAEELLDFVKINSNAKIIIDSIDIEFLRLSRQLKFGTITKEQVENVKQRELAIYRKAESVVVASEPDQKELRKYGDFRTIMLPCLYEINLNYKTFEGRNSYIICNWTHQPNIFSTTYLCKEIIPNLDTKFHIVGKHPPKEIVEFANEKIEVCGCEYEIKKFLNRMNVLFCPMFYGAGVNGKVLESLSFGIPTVISQLAALPIGAKHLEHCMIAETKEDFIDCANQIFNNKELREKLSTNGRELMKKFTVEFWQDSFLKEVG